MVEPYSAANCFITKLPEAIIADIFLRLTFATLIECRRVCKYWRQFLRSTYFVQSFQARGPKPLVICRSGKLFYILEGEESSLAAISTHQKGSDYASFNAVLHLVNSCNGLLCMTRCLGSELVYNSTCSLSNRFCYGRSVFVVNPVTNEYIALPPSPKGMRMNLCGLGFCAKTNQFKALRILSKPSIRTWRVPADSVVVEVYTLGSGIWRRIELDMETFETVFLGVLTISNLSCVNGALYWMFYLNSSLPQFASFNFENERFQKLTDSPYMEFVSGFGSLKGCLFLCGFAELTDVDYHSSSDTDDDDSSIYTDDDDDDDDSDGDIDDDDNGGDTDDDSGGVAADDGEHYSGGDTDDGEVHDSSDTDDDDDGEIYSDNDIDDDELKCKMKLFMLNKTWGKEKVIKFPKGLHPSRDRVIACFDNGDILLLICYYLYLFVKEKQDFKRCSKCMIRSEEDAVVHVPSFVSLKDVAKGESSKVLSLGLKASPELLSVELERVRSSNSLYMSLFNCLVDSSVQLSSPLLSSPPPSFLSFFINLPSYLSPMSKMPFVPLKMICLLSVEVFVSHFPCSLGPQNDQGSELDDTMTKSPLVAELQDRLLIMESVLREKEEENGYLFKQLLQHNRGWSLL